MLAKLLNRLGAWISPCVLCLTIHNNAQPLCAQCIENLPWIKRACIGCGLPLVEGKVGNRCGPCLIMPLPFDAVKTLFEYKWPCDQFIAQIKFKQKLEFVNVLAELMASQFGIDPNTYPTCLIPVPLHPTRLKERGFNQAHLLAKVIGKKLNIPVAWDYVTKIKKTQTQSSLSLDKRLANLKDVFKVTPHFPEKFKLKVAIIDDVMTSGETVSSLTMSLKAAGVDTVEVWCCCRTLKPQISKRSPLLGPILKEKR